MHTEDYTRHLAVDRDPRLWVGFTPEETGWSHLASSLHIAGAQEILVDWVSAQKSLLQEAIHFQLDVGKQEEHPCAPENQAPRKFPFPQNFGGLLSPS